MKRRTLLLAGTAGAGALLVGWLALPQRSRLGSRALLPAGEGEVALNGWIKVGADGSIVLAMPRSEMGQGVYTALPMLAAEELDVPLSAVRIERAGTDAIYGNVASWVTGLPFHPQEGEREDGFGRVKAARWVVGKVARELGINATGGSTSVADAWEVVRTAAATARATLLGAAALQWRLPVDELSVAGGVVSHPSGRSARYADLAARAAATPPGTVQLKAPQDWRLIGKAVPRLDIPGKVDGRATFGIDVRLPGLKYAAIRLCPLLGGQPGRIDAGRALALPGAERLVLLPALAGSTAGFAVLGRTSWHALRAAAAVDVDWHAPPGPALNTDAISQALEEAVRGGDGFVFHETGDVDAAAAEDTQVVEGWYRAPYLAHATMEPMNCTARVRTGTVEVWVPTQVPSLARDVAARVAGVPADAVTVHVPLLGGGFGRRLEVDYVAQAVRVAMDAGGAPVQLLWSREEDTTHDFYRPMQVARLRAVLGPGGRVDSLAITSAGDAVAPRWMQRAVPALAPPVDLPDKTTAEGLFDLPYAIANQRMAHVATRSGVPVGYWRSVGHSHNAFFSEGFVDELAAAGRVDPVEFRRRLLKGEARHLAVLELAARRGGWGQPLPPGRARGVALHESFGTIVAQVVEVSLEQGAPRVHRVVCALDCGMVVNPGIVAQQMEGAVVFALTAALHGGIDIRGGRVVQRNFTDAPLVTAARAPRVETWIVPSQRPPSGVGESGVPPLAPAVANALFSLTGQRLRSLPLRLE
ncbi:MULTISPECIES: xanthine dehydrogenase family protein molybdopterin-binding subunit [Ramlibacter]|uniref:xanthine dehydrogenase family protein molybdopterin-binding subunit n=1 Tax=Ramlibacter TaxID=174951 RepID=UPI0015EF150A|nr:MULTISPECIES: molybdopterin cofactor-binding domain-containing protein [Ramlibacter]MBA2965427.1 xanthine dehydrogenase family protein molybdopterin-binding subunit [Ramlibacter sp. CGMCC 1.13660]